MSAMSESTVMSTYVSSSGYYGYVPPIGQLSRNQSDFIYKSDVILEKKGGTEKKQENYYCDDMETDDNQHQQQAIRNGMHCQNNHYVIPEMVVGGGNGDFIVNNGTNVATMQMQMHWQLSRENRKRTNRNEVDHCPGGGKRIKSGGGNGLLDGAEFSREYRSSQVHNSTSLPIAVTERLTKETTLYRKLSDAGCNGVAANPCKYSINNEPIDYHTVRENTCTKNVQSIYEKMLMETHGCSAYHHQRHQDFDSGTVETEF